jgi:hypothetical protein
MGCFERLNLRPIIFKAKKDSSSGFETLKYYGSKEFKIYLVYYNRFWSCMLEWIKKSRL